MKRVPVSIHPLEYSWLRDASEVTGVPISRLVHRALAAFREGDGRRLVESLAPKEKASAAKAGSGD